MRMVPTRMTVGVGLGLVLGATLFVGQRALARGNVGAPVKQAAANHTITVSGHGEVALQPNMASLSIGVDSRATDAKDAQSANAAKMTQVINAIEGQGIPAKNIQTSDLSLYFDQEKNQYVASNQVTVVDDDVNTVGTVLDAAVAAGANNSWGVSFGLKDPSAGRTDALTAAVADARKHADALASALGVSNLGVGSASEVNYSAPPVRYGPVQAAASSAPSTPVQPGQLTVSADITVVYTFG